MKAKTLSDYPQELVQKRAAIECNFIFSLYKEPDLIGDYTNIVNGTDIITDDGIFYYGLAQNLDRAGYNVFDNISIYTFLNDKEVLKKGFERRGGFKTIMDITQLLNTENIDSYYDELSKNNILLRLYDKNFPVVKEIDKFNEMTSEQVYDYFDYQLNDICIGKVEKTKVVNLSKDYEPFIKEWDSGSQMGYPIGFPLMNSRLAGVHKKNLLLHLAHVGRGKTSTSILFYILPVLEQGQNVLVLGNEQTESEWRSMILSSVVFNKIKYYGMTRSKFVKGHFSEDDLANIKKAIDWLGEEGRGTLSFVELQDYNFKRVRKLVKKYAKLGYGIVVLDTLKPEQENSERAWADFSEAAKGCFQVAKKEDIAFIATAQLSSESSMMKYLDLNCIGKAKAIAETAAQVVMFRFLTGDEKEKLKPFTYQKDESGKWSNVKVKHDLDVDKSYIVVFTPKNRFGETNTQIVYEYNQQWNQLKEIGFIEISQNGFSR